VEKPAKRCIDWEAMEADWRAGVKSVLQLSKEHGVSRAAILKHWDKEGVPRDLAARIEARANSLVTQAAVTREVTPESRVTERNIVEANAAVIADAVINQRADVRRARATVQRLWSLVDAELDYPAELAKLGAMMQAPDEFGNDKLNEMYMAAISLPQQIKNAKLLADAIKIMIELERKVLRIDDAPTIEDDARRAGAAGAAAVVAGVDVAMQALAARVQGNARA
jgi:hypothetical protein